MYSISINNDTRLSNIKIINGANSHNITASPSTSSNFTLTSPPNNGTSNYFLKTDGTGITTWNSANNILTGVSAQTSTVTTNIDQKTVTFSSAFSGPPTVVVTIDGSSNDFVDRFMNSFVVTSTAANFTCGVIMKYNAQNIVAAVSTNYFSMTLGSNGFIYAVYINGTSLINVINLSVNGYGYWAYEYAISAIANPVTPSLLLLTTGSIGVSYQNTATNLIWGYNLAPINTGLWTNVTVDATATSGVSPKSVLLANGLPVIFSKTGTTLRSAVSTSTEGLTGTWTNANVATNVSNFDGGYSSSFFPIVIYFNTSTSDLIRKINAAVDMSGLWTDVIIANIPAGVIDSVSYVVLNNGFPSAAYYNSNTGDLKLAVGQNISGTGAWNIYTITATGGIATLKLLKDGSPAVVYKNGTTLYMSVCSTTDGSGSWSTSTIATSLTSEGSFITTLGGFPCAMYSDATNLNFCRSALYNRFPTTTSYNINWFASV